MNQPLTAAVRFLSGEREPVRVASTGNLSLTGLSTVDGVALAVGDRVLVKDQTDKRLNGIYLASIGKWYRSPDAGHPRAIAEGVTVQVQEGTVNEGRTYRFATTPVRIGESEIEIAFYLSATFAEDAGDIISAGIGQLEAAADAKLIEVVAEITDTATATLEPLVQRAEAAEANIDTMIDGFNVDLALKQDADSSLSQLSGKTIGFAGLAVLASSTSAAAINAMGGSGGQFGNAQISDLDAGKLTGIIDPARLPVLPGNTQVMSSGALTALTAPQQAQINQGTLVTTSDGRRWIYTGSGSKTAEASYIEMADVTPEWAAIANKPTFGSAAAQDSTAFATSAQGAAADTAMQPGAFGLGVSGAAPILTDFEVFTTPTGFYQLPGTATGTWPVTSGAAAMLLVERTSGGWVKQTFTYRGDANSGRAGRTFQRVAQSGSVWSAWAEKITTTNVQSIALQTSGSASKTRTIGDRFGDVVDLDEFLDGSGNTGAAAANNAAMADLISYMAANPQKTYRSRNGRTFVLSSGNFLLPANTRLRMEGAKFRINGNIAAATTFLTTSDGCDIDALIAEVASGFTVSRVFCLNSQNNRVDLLKATAAVQQANTAAILDAAIRVYGSYHDVGAIETDKFDHGWAVWGDPALSVSYDVSIRSSRVRNHVRPGYVRNASGISVFDTGARLRSPNALSNPGHNGILLEGVEKARFIGGILQDAGEHGFRSGGFRDATAGVGSYVGTSRQITISDFQIEGSGQSGLKLWASTSQVHKDIMLNNIQCVDCGDDGNTLGFNDMGFMLQSVDGLTMNGCTVSSRDNAFGAYDSFFLHGISRGSMAGCRSYDAARNGLRLSEYSDDGTSGSIDAMGINSLDISDFVSDVQVGAGIYANFPGSSALRDIMIRDAHIVTCTNGVETNAVAARFNQPCYVSAFIRGQSGSKFVVPSTANLKTVDLSV